MSVHFPATFVAIRAGIFIGCRDILKPRFWRQNRIFKPHSDISQPCFLAKSLIFVATIEILTSHV